MTTSARVLESELFELRRRFESERARADREHEDSQRHHAWWCEARRDREEARRETEETLSALADRECIIADAWKVIGEGYAEELPAAIAQALAAARERAA